MKLRCKFGNREEIVDVDPDDPIYVLRDLLGVSASSIISYGGKIKIYPIRCGKTFREIGLVNYRRIISIIVYEQYLGGGETKICPQGCGREIPSHYESCSALLKDQPHYFD